MRSMDWAEASYFLQAGTRTAKVATVNAQSQPHVAPVWFTTYGSARCPIGGCASRSRCRPVRPSSTRCFSAPPSPARVSIR